MFEADVSALVLIADDNPLNLEVLSSALVSDGLDVAVANDGETVLKLVGREEPDLILLDALMPGIDGFETCRRLKADPATKDIPVMFMTALTDTRYRIEGFNVGAVDYVTKPFERGELLARVRTQISLRNTTRALQEKNAQLSAEIRERAAAEAALSELVRKLESRAEELRNANERISQELAERRRAEDARAALQEQIIAIQRDRLVELSAPLIPIMEGVMVMPLIGAIDAERAERAMQTALRGASERGAKYFIIDVTGAKTVDSTVASMMLKTAKGLELLGTRAIITGIRPEVAQTLVQLPLRFERIVITATVQAGLEHALRDRFPT